MLNTKLVLIEGLPGAGKSTTTVHLGKHIQQHGSASRWFREEDDPHPIPCLDFDLDGLPQKMVPLWSRFVENSLQEPILTVIESRLWQNTALYMYMNEMDVEEIVNFNQEVCRVLTPLSPVLIYLDQENTEQALRRMYAARGEEWMASVLAETTQYRWFRSRGVNDFTGWLQFFAEWHTLAERLFNDWSQSKLRISNPHTAWARAYREMHAFLQVSGK